MNCNQISALLLLLLNMDRCKASFTISFAVVKKTALPQIYTYLKICLLKYLRPLILEQFLLSAATSEKKSFCKYYTKSISIIVQRYKHN